MQISKAVFMSFEPVAYFCVVVVMLFYIYDDFLVYFFHLYGFHLHEKNLLLFLFKRIFLFTILY